MICISHQLHVYEFSYPLDLLVQLFLPLPFAFKSMQRMKVCDDEEIIIFKHLLLPNGRANLSHGFILTFLHAPPGLFAS